MPAAENRRSLKRPPPVSTAGSTSAPTSPSSPAPRSLQTTPKRSSSHNDLQSTNSHCDVSPPCSPTKVWRDKHLFVVLKELTAQGRWVETRRWNYGLEEELDLQPASSGDAEDAGEGSSSPRWLHPHLPQVSVFGMMEVSSMLTPEMVLLDVPGTNLEEICDHVLLHLVATDHLEATRHRDALETLSSSLPATMRQQRRRLAGESSPRRGDDSPLAGDIPAEPPSHHALDEEEFELLNPDVEEEAVELLVAEVDWVQEDVLVFVRLAEPVDLGIELDLGVSDEQRTEARFIFILFGPKGDLRLHERHIEVGEAVAALLQDEDIAEAAYSSQSPEQFCGAINERLHHLAVLPHIHRPTTRAATKRTQMLLEQGRMLQSARTLKSQKEKWDLRQASTLSTKEPPTLAAITLFARKFALPLLSGILLALILVNVDDARPSGPKLSHLHQPIRSLHSSSKLSQPLISSSALATDQ